MKVIHRFTKKSKNVLTRQNAHGTISADKLTKRNNMKHHNDTNVNRFRVLAPATLLLVASALQAFVPQSAQAAPMGARSLTLQTGSGGDLGSLAGGTVAHKFDFVVGTPAASIGSIRFLYCTDAGEGTETYPCTPPTGLDTSGVTLDAEGVNATGFSASHPTTNSVLLTRASSSAPTAADLSYTLGDILNPSPENYSFYVRIFTYTSTDGTGSATDIGAVAASTARAIVLNGYMPESLVFCAGATIDINGTTLLPECSTASAGTVYFNQVFSPEDTSYAVSQMAASTNAGSGYAITVNGPTLTSGSNTIAAMATAAQSLQGVAQFGLNLAINDGTAFGNTAPNILPYDNDRDGGTTPTVGSNTENINPLSDGVDFKGQAFPVADYGTAGLFTFNSGDVVANSAYDGTTNTTLGPTQGQRYTVSYIANVPGNQPAGGYTTTLLYICTPTF